MTELSDEQAEPRRQQNANMPEVQPKSKGKNWASPSFPGGERPLPNGTKHEGTRWTFHGVEAVIGTGG